LDTSDVDRWVGIPIGGGILKDPIHVNDIRRWAQGMQNPHPLYYDEGYAKESRFGQIVAPQSFTVCTSDSHGAGPSIQGRIDGSHMLFGGDEWWFSGPRIFPGDQIRLERKLVDYQVKDTKFAGPTLFPRGDTTYINQRGEVVARQRCTSIRYLAEEARKRASNKESPEPDWTDEQLAALEARKREYYQTFRALGHQRRSGVQPGEKLPTRTIGPHSVASFSTEWRSYPLSIWGAFRDDGLPTSLRQAGWLPDMDKDVERAKIDPSEMDGMYKGSSRGHVNARYAQRIGLPRGYGYGASMGAWILDYLSNWAGEVAEIVHSKMAYKAPVLTGDVTYLNGEVTHVAPAEGSGKPLASLRVEMTNQRDEIIASGVAEVAL
jgi:acyl dehydratase